MSCLPCALGQTNNQPQQNNQVNLMKTISLASIIGLPLYFALPKEQRKPTVFDEKTMKIINTLLIGGSILYFLIKKKPITEGF